LTLRRPRSFTLFPYTTLFRSEGLGELGLAVVGEQPDVQALDVLPQPVVDEALAAGAESELVADLLDGLAHARVVEHDAVARELADRKSTRLNSSHVKISYAVF